VRDLISWVDFFITMEKSLGPEHALLHGVFLVLLDGLSLGMICLFMIFRVYYFPYFLCNICFFTLYWLPIYMSWVKRPQAQIGKMCKLRSLAP